MAMVSILRSLIELSDWPSPGRRKRLGRALLIVAVLEFPTQCLADVMRSQGLEMWWLKICRYYFIGWSAC